MNPLPNILIVDDIEENLVYLETIIKKFEVNLIRAESGYEALKKAEGVDFALAIVDVFMPEMNGYELAVKLNKNRTDNVVPVIFLTASMNNETEMIKGYNAGAVDYIFKPVNNRILIGKVSVFIDLYNQKQLLLQANADMEMRINERTAELAEANFKLQIESDNRQKIIEKEKELNALKSQFLSTVSHEFRTPLAGIHSSTQLLKLYYDKWDEKKREKIFKQIFDSIHHTIVLLDDVSIINKGQSNTITVKPKLLNLQELLNEIVSENIQVYGRDKIILKSFHLDKSQHYLDPEIIRYIFGNILSNALKYSGASKKIFFNVTEKNQNLIFKIIDSGIGIPDNDKRLLFKPFYRASNVEAISGTGFGLSIVKGLVDLLKGKIEIVSEIKKGTTVNICLPYKYS